MKNKTEFFEASLKKTFDIKSDCRLSMKNTNTDQKGKINGDNEEKYFIS